MFVQNLKPGAIAKLGIPARRIAPAHPRLVICSISGYGEDGPYAQRKAYDMLVQAEIGLASVTGSPEAPARVGVSVCDIAAGMNAYEAILEALYAREKTGDGAAISISMFDAMAEWMAVPLIQYEGGAPPQRIGLAHPSIAPYGAFKTKDGADILISIQLTASGACWRRRFSATRRSPPIPPLLPTSRALRAAPRPTRASPRCSAQPTKRR